MTALRDIYESREEANRLFIRFSSDMVHIDTACGMVLLYLKAKGPKFFPHLFAVNLGMREALANAVRHGNKFATDKLVTMELDVTREKWLRLIIHDQGKGFDWIHTQNQTAPAEADHGRGMSIMRTYFDRFSYNEKGNTLYLEKQIQ